MTDDRKPRRAATHSDDRDRRRAPLRGVPIEIDPELTPPPQEMPAPSSMDGYDSIPPPIKEQLAALAHGHRDVIEALGKLWDTRKDGARLDRIESNLGTLAKSATQSETILEQYVKPQLDHWRATTDAIARDLPKMLAALEGVTLTVQAIDHRLRNLEVRMETSAAKADAQHAAIEKRILDAEAVHRRHELRLKEIEDKQLTADATEKALAKTSRKSGGASGGVVAVIVYVAAAVAQHFAK